MRPEVMSQMSRSAQAFHDVVWPRVKSLCDGGALIAVEGSSTDRMRKHLDTLAGVDAWQVVEGHGMRGVASRVQWVGSGGPFNTFTIRCKTKWGNETEIHKLKRAIIDGGREWLAPSLTIQAYLTKDGKFLSAGCVATSDLIRWAVDEIRAKRATYRWNGADGNKFMACGWRDLTSAGVAVQVVEARNLLRVINGGSECDGEAAIPF